jgi:putative PIG3 family NAD(P)H quinone oxidoreductase
VPDPVPGPGEVLVDVVACGVNRADVVQRAGYYTPPPGASPYLGLECSGRVAALGPAVTGWRVGDEVCALLAGGGYAQQVTVPAGQLLPVPDGVDLIDAAGLPEVACTVWSNLAGVARLRAGETLLVHGGGSGIGTFAIQFARALDARVLTTARAVKHDALAKLGADVCVDYTVNAFEDDVREATGGRGVDVILDMIGAAYLARNLAALAPYGRLVIIGLQGGRTAEIDLGAMSANQPVLTVTTLRSRPLAEKAAIVAEVRDRVWPLIGQGRIRPVVDRRLPLSEAARAHEVLARNDHIGKVLLLAR